MNNTTLVTAYYELNKYEKRPEWANKNNYLKWGEKLLNLDIYLVIFIEPENYDFVLKCRKDKMDKTLIIIKKYDDLVWTNRNPDLRRILKNKPIENSTKNKDSDNYLYITWNKIYLVEEVINLNPFNHNHFGWIDFGLYHVIEKNLPTKLDSNYFITKDPRVKVLQLRYISKKEIENLDEYTRRFRWKIAGGLWTGHKVYMSKFINLFKQNLYMILSKNLPAHEETIFSLIFTNHRELFNPYHGDYYLIMINYNGTQRVDNILLNLIKDYRKHEEKEYAFKMCEDVINKCLETLTQEQRFDILDELIILGYYIDQQKTLKYIEKIVPLIKPNKLMHEAKARVLTNITFYNAPKIKEMILNLYK